MFNPSRYNHLHTHFGYDIDKLKSYFRSAHLLANRNGEFPLNMGLFFDGKVKRWAEMPKADDTAALNTWYNTVRELEES